MKISSSGIAGGLVTGLLLAAVVIAARLLWETVQETEPLPLDLDPKGQSLTSSALPPASAAIGHILAIVNPVTATRPDGTLRTLTLQSPVFPNDTIKTAPGAKLQILFADDSIVAQGENSEMTIDEYVYQPGDKTSRCSLHFASGLFRAITGKITDLNPARFNVKTHRATIGIRGCELAFQIEATRETIYILELPPDRSIHIESHPVLATGRPDLGSVIQAKVIRDQGTVVHINEAGQMEVHPISQDEALQIMRDTTPPPPVFQPAQGRHALPNPNRPGDSASFDQPETPPAAPTEQDKQDHANDRIWKVPYGEHLKLDSFSFKKLQSDSPVAVFPIALHEPLYRQMPQYIDRLPNGLLPDPFQQDPLADVQRQGRVTAYTTTTTTTTTTTGGGGGDGNEGGPPIEPPLNTTSTSTSTTTTSSSSSTSTSTSTSTTTTTTTTTTSTTTTTIVFPPVSDSGI